MLAYAICRVLVAAVSALSVAIGDDLPRCARAIQGREGG